MPQAKQNLPDPCSQGSYLEGNLEPGKLDGLADEEFVKGVKTAKRNNFNDLTSRFILPGTRSENRQG